MGVALGARGLSPNIKERRDYSCALFDADGRLVAQAAHIPVHLGSTALSVRAVLEQRAARRRATSASSTIPFAGGTHLPDITLVRAGLRRQRTSASASSPIARTTPTSAARAPGRCPSVSAPAATRCPRRRRCRRRCRRATPSSPAPSLRTRAVTIAEEGLRIPPSLLDDALLAQLCAVARGPTSGAAIWRRSARRSTRCATTARARATRTAQRRWRRARAALIAYGESLLRAAIARHPRRHLRLRRLARRRRRRPPRRRRARATSRIVGDRAVIDFSDSDEEVPGRSTPSTPSRSRRWSTPSACSCPRTRPPTTGCYAPLEVIAPAGSCWPRSRRAPSRPATSRPRSASSTWCSARWRKRCPSASPRQLWHHDNLLIGDDRRRLLRDHRRRRRRQPAGAPARRHPDAHDQHAQHADRGVRARAAAARRRYARRRGSGGGGAHRGGDGLVREFELLAPTRPSRSSASAGAVRRTGSPAADPAAPARTRSRAASARSSCRARSVRRRAPAIA